MRRHLIATSAAAAFLGCVAQQASAAEIIIDATGRGWVTQTGHANGDTASNNYLVGSCSALSCASFPGEYRNFFDFDIPELDGVVVGAVLRLDSGDTRIKQSSSLTYQVTSTESLTFGDLGNGEVFGARDYTSSDLFVVRDIQLNASAISAISLAEGAALTMSGRVSSPKRAPRNPSRPRSAAR